MPRIHRDRAARRQGPAERAQGAVCRAAGFVGARAAPPRRGTALAGARRQLAEEHVTRIGVEHLVQPRWVGPRPGLDTVHRRFIGLELALLDQITADGLVGVPVLVGVADAQQLAALQLYPARSLYLQEEGFDRVVDPGYFLPGHRA